MWTGAALAAPFFNGDKHGGIAASLCHELGPLRQTSLQHFAESRLGVLHRPSFQGGPD